MKAENEPRGDRHTREGTSRPLEALAIRQRRPSVYLAVSPSQSRFVPASLRHPDRMVVVSMQMQLQLAMHNATRQPTSQ